MSFSPAIHAQQLGKTFQLYDRPIDRLKQMVARGDKRYYREFAALHDVSFELQKGEVLGLVGRNGAGKSTLLQLICGTLTPSSGQIAVHGRIAALLELGAGFNPDFTGRENIYLNASILGLSKAEIDERYDAIVDFSGISDFIHQPVKTYSSGMYVRLAFSIATSVDPDILVIDEALSVGDGAFARKSFDRIMTLRDKGATILFCSHSMYQVEALCTRAVWLEKGTVQQMGNPASVVARYQSFLDRDAIQTSTASRTHASPQGHARILAVQTRVDDAVGTSLEVQSAQQTLGISVGFASDPALPSPVVAVTINGPDGRILASSSTHADGLVLARDESGRGTATIEFPKIPLLKGEYFVWVYLLSEDGIHIYDTASNVATLHFSQQTLEQGMVTLAHSWQGAPGAESSASLAEPSAPVVSTDPLEVLGAVAATIDASVALTEVQSAVAAQHPALAVRFGLACNERGEWTRQRPARWRLGWVGREQQAALHDLLKASSGDTLSAALWKWKYRDADRWGVGVWEGDELVAFCGGAPRAISYFGQSAMALQRVDALINPLQGDALANPGPFQMAAATLAEQQIGDGKTHLLDFGFVASNRLLQLEPLGLYAQADSMTELRWPALSGLPSLQTFARPVADSNAAVVDRLWLEMKRSLQGSIVCVRDWAFVRGRYLEHPLQPYTVLLVRRRLSRAAVGIVVLRDRQAQGLELVDFVAPPERFHELLDVARRFAGKLGRSEVFAWITASHADLLAEKDSRRSSLDLIIPANIWSPGPAPEEIRGHWWLMAGDTDFR